MLSNLRNLIIGLIFSISSLAHAQDSTVTIYPRGDTLVTGLPIVTEYKTPAIYQKWFERIAKCTGANLPPQEEIDNLRFVQVNSTSFQVDSANHLNYDGLTLARARIIIVSLKNVYDYRVIAHEFLHFALYYQYGIRYLLGDVHAEKYFDLPQCNIRRR